MPLPHLTDEQRVSALEKATAARRRRAEIKARLKDGELTLSAVLELADEDTAIAMMRVRALLESLPRVGDATATRLMGEIGISKGRRVRGLGIVQRSELIRRFG